MDRVKVRSSRTAGVAALAAVGALVVPGISHASDDVRAQLQALQARIEAQETELRQLRNGNSNADLEKRRADEVRQLVHEVLADASTRSAFLQEGVTAGYNRGFFIKSAEGEHELRVGLTSQFRYLFNSQDETAPTQGEEVGGFQFRRTQVDLQGHAFDPRWTYRLRLDASNGGGVSAAWAWVGFQLTDELNLRVGQQKASFLREENVGATNQLAIERSYLADYFTTDFSQGLTLTWQKDRLKLEGALHNGSYGWRTDFNQERTEFAVTGRAEYLLVAENVRNGWRQFSDFSTASNAQTAVLLGAAFDYEQGARVNNVVGSRAPDILKWTVDASAEIAGWNLFAAVVGQQFSSSDAALDDASQLGVVAQVGYFVVPDKFEVFGRYEYIDFDGTAYRHNGNTASGPTAADDLSIITVGGNYYLRGNNLKLSLDVIYALDAVPQANTGQGLLATGALASDEKQFAVRSQLQFRF